MKKPLFALSAILLLMLGSCDDAQENLTEIGSNNPFQINFSSEVPKDLAADANDTMLVNFAWEEFIALNWKSSYDITSKRDSADTSWKWEQGEGTPELVVWETYAHRTELRPYSDIILPFDNAPHYSFGDTVYKATPSTSFELFNNLDENNEIGSCNLYAHANTHGQDDMVLYQAKVNRDEYDYIRTNFPSDSLLGVARSNGTIDLPAGGLSNPNGGTYTGAIEVKTGWRLLLQDEDASKFFTRKVIYYREVNDSIIYYNRTFALIGLHIIHKTKNHKNFVFATWEHVDVEKDNMAFVLLDSVGNETGGLHENYKRLHAIPDIVTQSTDSVHAQMHKMDSTSIWKNYRLIGVQGQPTNDISSMSFFLANFVIESDSTLANFRGSSIGSPHQMPSETIYNNTYKGKRYLMGGCMGCHGVTQKKGNDFSFLLDTIGKPVKRPDLLENLPGGVGKLEQYIRSFN